jgi:nucleoside phosphorylase
VPVVLAVSGEGKRNADLVTKRVVQVCAPTRILGLGLAGALSPKLRAGEILVSSEVMEGGSVLAWPDLQWLDAAVLTVPHDRGRLVTVDEILSTPAMKDEWWGKTMRDQPAAGDMESACFARVATAYQIPYLVVRAISDAADETLPHFLEDCRAQDGRLDRRQVFWKAFWRPASWNILWRLNGRLKRCARLLADVTEQLVAAVDRDPR